MFHRILLCYDASAEGRTALAQGADVAICMQAETHLLAIMRSLVSAVEGVTPSLIEAEDATAAAILRDGVEWLRQRGLSARGHLVHGDPILTIPTVAKRIGADLIVVGRRRRGPLSRWWSDSDDVTLLDHVHCSVLAALIPGDASDA